jgi:hypothetical protein
MRSKVVLPQPRRPQQREKLARLDREADVVDRDERVEATRNVANFEKGHAASRRKRPILA